MAPSNNLQASMEPKERGNLRQGRKAKKYSTVMKRVMRSQMSRWSRREVGFEGLVHTGRWDDPAKEPGGAWLSCSGHEPLVLWFQEPSPLQRGTSSPESTSTC